MLVCVNFKQVTYMYDETHTSVTLNQTVAENEMKIKNYKKLSSQGIAQMISSNDSTQHFSDFLFYLSISLIILNLVSLSL